MNETIEEALTLIEEGIEDLYNEGWSFEEVVQLLDRLAEENKPI